MLKKDKKVMRKILDGVIDTITGEVKINEFQVNEIPKIIEE